MPFAQALALSVIAPILTALLKVKAARSRMVTAGGHASATPSSTATFRSRVWVYGRRGEQTATARLEAGEGYAVAAEIAVLAVEAYFAQPPCAGAYTPATAFGANFISRSSSVAISRSWTSEARNVLPVKA